jgi:type II secretory pathway pseudopilin PulG
MCKPFPHWKKSAVAFTLIELLVGMSVLVLIMVMVSQLVNSTTRVATESRKHLEADAQARLVFSRMQSDFSNIVKRTDVDNLFVNSNSNDINEKIFFYSQTAAYYDSSTPANEKNGAALVGYRVVGAGGDLTNFAPAFSLESLGKGLTWSGSNGVVHAFGVANTLAATWPTALGTAPGYTGATPSDPDFHVLSDQVFRMAICFQVKDLATSSSAYSNYPLAVSSSNPSTNACTISSSAPSGAVTGDHWYDTQNCRACLCTSANSTTTWQPNGFKDVISIVVTLAVLDNTSRTMVSKDSSGNVDLSSLTALFPAPVGDSINIVNQLPATTWEAALGAALKKDAATFKATYGIPKTAAAQIRIYQRHFFLAQ